MLGRIRCEVSTQRATRTRFADVYVGTASGRELEREHRPRGASLEQLPDSVIALAHSFRVEAIVEVTGSNAMSLQFRRGRAADAYLDRCAAERGRIGDFHFGTHRRTQ